MIAVIRSGMRRDGARSAKTAEPLDLTLIPWLLATGTATLLPHFNTLPVWLPVGASSLLAWRIWSWRQGTLTGNKWLVLLLAGVGMISVFVEYRTLFGQEPGVALLVLLMSLKLMELRTTRDAIVVVMLGYFLLLTHYFQSENIPAGIWMLFALLITTATLIRLQAPGAGSPVDTVKFAGTLILQALPVMAILFVLFPRISGPLWGLPQDANKAKSGLSDEMSPGSISDLSLSSALAFRAEFKLAAPARNLLYWRGPVLNDFDGRTWKVARSDARQVASPTAILGPGSAAPPLSDSANLTEYAITLEPHQQRWLLALDLPVKHPAGSFLTPGLSVISPNPVRDRRRVEFTSLTRYRVGVDESPHLLNRSVALPSEINPRSRELAASWRSQSDQAGAIAAKALQYFQEQGFVYTLQPPLLGKDSIDDFLFTTKRGFCEHYASSFVFLMRAAGIPARVVAGYLGGEINPVDGHLTVRQSDAHAWAEIWTRTEGWIRIDPTASIAPNRVEENLQASLPVGEALPPTLRPQLDWLRTLRYRWDAVDYAWNRWVLGYDADRQRKLLAKLGLGGGWTTLIALLAIVMGILGLSLAIWITRRKPDRDPAQALWNLACAAFAKIGLARASGEGPSDYAKRIAEQSPPHAELARAISDHYIRLRYAHTDHLVPRRSTELSALQREVARLVPRWKIWSCRL